MALLLLLLISVSFLFYYIGKKKAVFYIKNIDQKQKMHSLPIYHGRFVAFWVLIPGLIFLLGYQFLNSFIVNKLVSLFFPLSYLEGTGLTKQEMLSKANIIIKTNIINRDPNMDSVINYISEMVDRIHLMVGVLTIILALGFGIWAFFRIKKAFRARVFVERYLLSLLILCSFIAIVTTIGIFISLFWESLKFFDHVNLLDFLFGTQWSPQTALREDQIGQKGAFGAVPLFYGTSLITLIALFVAGPVGLFSAIYLSEYASRGARKYIKPILEILAGIPTVVYGFFAALTIAPLVRNLAESVGIEASSRNALSAGVVMGLMIIPFVSSLSDDIIHAVPQSLRDGSYALGSTKSETVKGVVFPAALPGIIGALLLAVSRAVGETMIVVMAAGQAANITANPLDSVTTITVQIVALITGDDAFDSPKTLSAFALGLVLFFFTLVLNVIALQIERKYREKYD